MRMILLSMAVVLAACGGGDGGSGPSIPDVAGSWRFAAQNLSGSGVSCSFANAPLNLDQSGDTFTGTYGPVSGSCLGGGESFDFTVQGTVVNGTITQGGAVQFDLDSPDFHHSGNLSGNSMSGTARWFFDLGSQTVTLNGQWSAAKQ